LAPHLSAAYLTSLLGTPIENLTVGQIRDLIDALKRVASGEARNLVVGTLLK
jgi:hypothetical protein